MVQQPGQGRQLVGAGSGKSSMRAAARPCPDGAHAHPTAAWHPDADGTCSPAAASKSSGCRWLARAGGGRRAPPLRRPPPPLGVGCPTAGCGAAVAAHRAVPRCPRAGGSPASGRRGARALEGSVSEPSPLLGIRAASPDTPDGPIAIRRPLRHRLRTWWHSDAVDEALSDPVEFQCAIRRQGGPQGACFWPHASAPTQSPLLCPPATSAPLHTSLRVTGHHAGRVHRLPPEPPPPPGGSAPQPAPGLPCAAQRLPKAAPGVQGHRGGQCASQQRAAAVVDAAAAGAAARAWPRLRSAAGRHAGGLGWIARATMDGLLRPRWMQPAAKVLLRCRCTCCCPATHRCRPRPQAAPSDACPALPCLAVPAGCAGPRGQRADGGAAGCAVRRLLLVDRGPLFPAGAPGGARQRSHAWFATAAGAAGAVASSLPHPSARLPSSPPCCV